MPVAALLVLAGVAIAADAPGAATLERSHLADPATTTTREAEPPAVVATETADTIPAPPEHFDGPARVAAPFDPGPAPRVGGTGVWTVSIGINDYPGQNGDLRSAVNDARDFDRAMAEFGIPATHRVLLLDGHASTQSIRAAARWLVSHAGPNATAVFFYAGHVRKLGVGSEAIIGAEGAELADRTLAADLAGLRAKQSWVVIAACFGGGFNEVLAPGRILTAGADANHSSYENLQFARSYLVQYLVVEGWLRHHAGPSVQEAFAYAVKRLQQDYPNRVPVQYDELGRPLLLTNGPTVAPTPDPTPAPAPAPTQPTTPPSDGGGTAPAPGDDSGPSDDQCTLNGLVKICG